MVEKHKKIIEGKEVGLPPLMEGFGPLSQEVVDRTREIFGLGEKLGWLKRRSAESGVKKALDCLVVMYNSLPMEEAPDAMEAALMQGSTERIRSERFNHIALKVLDTIENRDNKEKVFILEGLVAMGTEPAEIDPEKRYSFYSNVKEFVRRLDSEPEFKERVRRLIVVSRVGPETLRELPYIERGNFDI